MPVAYVPADIPHLRDLHAFIFEHGTNEWNYLPVAGIEFHMRDIAAEEAHGLLAMEDGQMLGAVTFCLSENFARFQPSGREDAEHGYICEVVVRRDQAGRGLGTQLLHQAVAALQALGVQEVYIDRHEENAASAGMMRKAGFTEIETYADPERRPNGSGRSTVCRMLLTPD